LVTIVVIVIIIIVVVVVIVVVIPCVCVHVYLQSVVSTVTRRSGVLPMCVAVTSVYDLKLLNFVVTVVNRTLTISQPPQRQPPQV